MDDPKLSIEEARRARQHGEVKADVERQVQSEVSQLADRRAATDAPQLNRVASDLRQKAVVEVTDTEREVERARGLARVSQVVDYVFGIVYVLLGIRLLLGLLAARPGAGFVQWVIAVSDPFYAPFRGIFPNITSEQGFTFAGSVAFAILIYAVLHFLIKAMLRMIAHRRTAI